MFKKFGDRFPAYDTLSIAHVAIFGSKKDYEELSRFGVAVTKDQLPEITPPPHYVLNETKGRPVTLSILAKPYISNQLEAEIKEIKIGIAPTPNVYQIPPDQPDLSSVIKGTLAYYDYYLVELGLNVLTGKEAKIPALRFEVDLRCDGARTDVTAYDIMPKDTIKRVKVIEGKVSLGISKLLGLIPGPIGILLPNLLSIDINPWEFSWSLTKYQIDASGPKNYEIYWLLYDTETVQSFNPTMILKVRKNVKKVTATVRAIYDIKTGLLSTKEPKSDEKIIPILPL